MLLLFLLLIISVSEVATGQPTQADHSGNLGVLFQKCLSRPGSNDIGGRGGLITQLDLVSNTQTNNMNCGKPWLGDISLVEYIVNICFLTAGLGDYCT